MMTPDTFIGPPNLPAQQWFYMFVGACVVAVLCGVAALVFWFKLRSERRTTNFVRTINLEMFASISDGRKSIDKARHKVERLEKELEELKCSWACLMQDNRRLNANRPKRNKLGQYAKRETEA